MATTGIPSRGFGTFGRIALVVTRGFGAITSGSGASAGKIFARFSVGRIMGRFH